MSAALRLGAPTPPERDWMRAVTCARYGGPEELRLEEDVPRPRPGAAEVLLRVVASSLNAGDVHLVRGRPKLMRPAYGFSRPRHPILGMDVAGTVVAVGPEVTRFAPGDAVFGDLSGHHNGAFAEWALATEDSLAHKPPSVSFEDAACVAVAGGTALLAVREVGEVTPGDEVLIVGASGGVGSFAVQLAKAAGARVTAVCRGAKVGACRSLGADAVVDHERVDPTTVDARYDVIVDAGAYRPHRAWMPRLEGGGRYVLVGGDLGLFFRTLFASAFSKRIRVVTSDADPLRLEELGRLLEAGELRALVARRYSLAEVGAAMAHLESGESIGKIGISVRGDGGRREARGRGDSSAPAR